MKSLSLGMLIGGLLMSNMSLGANGIEKKISRKSIPLAVLDSFSVHYPHAVINGQKKGKEEGAILYELETADSAVQRTLLYRSDGTLVEIKEAISEETIPTTVRKSIVERYPKAIILSGVSVTREKQVEYELTIMLAGKKVRIVVNSAGKIFRVR